ncbi:MAG: carboxylesterase [Burkholderiales bacterium]|nr:carboxylesterase [Burkholderiales bacterium]
MSLSTIEFQTEENPGFSIIWLHGLGADGNDFVPVAQSMDLPFGVRFVFPHAPVLPVTINGGYRMRAWYDIYSLSPGGREDREGIEASSRLLEELMMKEHARGIPFDRIFLAGFSQGAALVLHAGLRFRERIAGIVALSTYLPLASTLDREANPANAGIPVFLAHGDEDDVIPVSAGFAVRDVLSALGHRVDWHRYPMAHSVNGRETADISSWLENIMSGDVESPKIEA